MMYDQIDNQMDDQIDNYIDDQIDNQIGRIKLDLVYRNNAFIYGQIHIKLLKEYKF